MNKLPVLLDLRPDRFKGIDLVIACSGGIDSLFAAHYLAKGKRSVALAYFNHGTEYADEAEQVVQTAADQLNCKFFTHKITGIKPDGQSTEEWYRNERYHWLRQTFHLWPIITGHHLDDAVETWVWGSCHGQPKLPELISNGVYRPFLACKKEAMKEWLINAGVQWIEDPSNTDTKFVRNYIRANVIPQLKQVNPGLDTVIQKKILAKATLETLKQTT